MWRYVEDLVEELHHELGQTPISDDTLAVLHDCISGATNALHEFMWGTLEKSGAKDRSVRRNSAGSEGQRTMNRAAKKLADLVREILLGEGDAK